MKALSLCIAAFAICLAGRAHAQDGWLLFRANPQRTGAVADAKPWDKRPAWQRPLLMDKYAIAPGEFIVDADDEAKKLIDDLRKNADPAILPGGFPLIVGNLAIYRSYRDVRAVALQNVEVKDETGKVLESLKPANIVWKGVSQDASIGVLMEKPQFRNVMPSLLKLLRATQQEQFLWANTTIGSMNADGKAVYVIADCAFPGLQAIVPKLLANIKPFVMQNELIAYDAAFGKILWELRGSDNVDVRDSLFLGAPLPLGGKLYALNEKAGELRLLRIDVDMKKWKVRYQPEIEKTLILHKVPEDEQAVHCPLRRTQTAQIAAAGDLLVCPTNAGFVFGIDRVKLAERWKYQYRGGIATAAFPCWQAGGVMIAKDRILIAAPDVNDLQCIDLAGKRKWIVAGEPNDRLYLGTVHDDLVLVVGKTRCRALKLDDGTEKWSLPTGLPAGVGVKDGSTYYLPLKSEGNKGGPAIWAIDIAKGTKLRRIDVPHPDALGNLALHRGMFVSQSATRVAAFPLLVPN